MKKIVGYSLIAAVGLLSACDKKLDQNPISQQATSTFYVNQNDFIQGINAAYSGLRTWPDRLLNLSETRSDNLYAVSDGGVREWEGINSFHKTIAGNSYVTEAWSGNYSSIFKVNTFLENLGLKGADVIPNPALRTRLEAEARFLRGFYYFDLVRWFGQVPLVDKTLTPAEALQTGRAAVNDVYSLILSDLKFAADSLPESYAAADKGRATKYAAKGILALVYMTRSGPTYGIKGPGLGVDEWGQALTLLNEIINSKKYTFGTNYNDIFAYDKENNGEVVFDVQYNSQSTPVVGATFPWLLAPDNWFTSSAIGKTAQGGLTIRPVSNDLLSAYTTGDTRKAFSIQTGYTYSGGTETRSFFKKYVDVSKTPANRLDWPINFIALRYTDVLMLKAECILHNAPGTQAEVDAIVNQVRTRAGLGAVANVTLSQLMDERRKEFAAEGSRWHDLVRSGLVETKMKEWIDEEDKSAHAMQPFQTNYILYPVPQSELDVKPGLYEQNLGYN